MATVILVVHLMIATAMVAVILLQRTEGGALGIGGGGGGGGGFMAGRGVGNVLTRLTAYMAVAFFATSITLSLLARQDAPPSIFEGVETPAPGTPGTDRAQPPLQPLQPTQPTGPQIPQPGR